MYSGTLHNLTEFLCYRMKSSTYRLHFCSFSIISNIFLCFLVLSVFLLFYSLLYFFNLTVCAFCGVILCADGCDVIMLTGLDSVAEAKNLLASAKEEFVRSLV